MEQSLAFSQPVKTVTGLRVIRIVADYPVGGKASYGLQPVYHNLSRAQAEKGHDVQVVARKYAGQPALEICEGVTVHRVSPPFTANAIRELRSLIRNGPTSVIHTHSTSGLFIAPLKRMLKTPVVSHVHGTTYSVATPAVLTFGTVRSEYSHWGVTTSFLREKALWSAADRIAAVSSSVQSDLISKYSVPSQRIRLVYNGVDTNLFRPLTPPRTIDGVSVDGKKVVLYVGHFGLRKGLPFLIRAMSAVVDQVKDSILVCVGGIPPWLPQGPYVSYLNELTSQQGLKGKVILLDRVQNERLPEFYSMADVLVLPSYYEAFAKVLIEAMACEKPVITTRLGGTVDSVVEGVNGFLVPYASPNDLAARILTLLQDSKLARRMGMEGRRRVLQLFTWEAVAQRIQAMYDEIVPDSRLRRGH